MTEIIRYTGNLKAFGSTSTGTNRTVFGDPAQSDTLDANINVQFLQGWEFVGVNDAPTKQDFNAMAFTNGQLHAYLYQVGTPEWDTSQEFFANKSIANEAGILYRAKTTNTGILPSTDVAGAGVNWETVSTTVPDASETVKGIVERATDAEAVTGTDTERFINPKQLKVVADAAGLPAAVQADQETATSNAVAVTPGVQQYHPSASKARVNYNGTGTIAIRSSYNITSIADNGTGDTSITIAVDFSSGDYSFAAMAGDASSITHPGVNVKFGVAPTAGVLRVQSESGTNNAADVSIVSIVMFGDQ
jgi:hypothetical protein